MFGSLKRTFELLKENNAHGVMPIMPVDRLGSGKAAGDLQASFEGGTIRFSPDALKTFIDMHTSQEDILKRITVDSKFASLKDHDCSLEAQITRLEKRYYDAVDSDVAYAKVMLSRHSAGEKVQGILEPDSLDSRL
jgi:hypothetical protein